MRTIVNKTRRPLKILLPRGKTLHLGPSGRGQVNEDALERPAFKKMVEAGEIEVLEAGDDAVSGGQSTSSVHPSTHGHPATKNVSRRGDR